MTKRFRLSPGLEFEFLTRSDDVTNETNMSRLDTGDLWRFRNLHSYAKMVVESIQNKALNSLFSGRGKTALNMKRIGKDYRFQISLCDVSTLPNCFT